MSGQEWSGLATGTAPANIPATLLTSLILLGYVFLCNHMIKLNTGTNPLKLQGDYFLAMAAASAVLGWLLSYLNLYTANWSSAQGHPILQLLLYSPIFALLAPAVLSTVALLGSLPGLPRLSRDIPASAPGNTPLAFGLASLAALGLLGGAAWPAQLFWLLWIAPLLLLIALQLLWHASTIFSGLGSGGFGRAICAVLAGIVAGNFALITYQTNGGELEINLTNPLFEQLGFAVFGLLCQQLGDVIAEHWPGETFQQKSTAPVHR